jgi:hypothetical protein
VFANAWFTTPPKVKLPDPSHLARIVTTSLSGPLFVAKSDLSNFYHHLELPVWLRPYFCLVGIPASDLGLDHAGDGTLLYPMLHTVPMGWSHSVDVAQAVHEHVVYSAGALRREHSLLSGSTDLSTPSAVRHGLYIDDLFLLSHSEVRANAQLDACLNAYQAAGLIAKSSKVQRASCDGVDVLGMEVHGRRFTVEVGADARVDLLQSAIKLLSQHTVTGLELSALVGRFTWCMLVRRPSLQCFHHVYRFIHTRRDRPSQLWPSAIREVLIASGLLPLLSATLTTPFSDRLLVTDASEYGGAVVSRPRSASESESHAEMVPSLASQHWSTIIQHRWRFKEHINALELRSILLALLWITSCKQTDHRIVLFTDSQVSLGVLTKGRTSAHTLLSVHKSIAALCLAAGLLLVPAYVPTHLNPADGPSRFHGPGPPSESHSLSSNDEQQQQC